MVAMKLEKRLELLKEKVQEDYFLDARGLGNENPFWIFDLNQYTSQLCCGWACRRNV
jgi:hypothetical protein